MFLGPQFLEEELNAKSKSGREKQTGGVDSNRDSTSGNGSGLHLRGGSGSGDHEPEGVRESVPDSGSDDNGRGTEANTSTDSESWSSEEVLKFGQMLRFEAVEKGLRELNSDISLDVPVRRSEDWTYMFTPAKDAVESNRKGRAALYYGDRYVCAIDRGDIPEIKVYGVEDGFEPINMSEIHNHDDSKVSFMEITKESPLYHVALTKAQNHDDNYTIADNGKVFLYQAFRWNKVRGPVQKLGWRHTFEKLLNSNIPGINRGSLSKKFNVDMLKYPVGAPEEVHDALFAE